MILRLFGTLCIAVAVVFAVGDIARSIADETTRMIGVGQALASFGVDMTPGSQTSPFLASVIATIALLPMSITAAILGFVLLVLGRRRRRIRPPSRR